MSFARGRPVKPILLVDEAREDCDGESFWGLEESFRLFKREVRGLDIWGNAVLVACEGMGLFVWGREGWNLRFGGFSVDLLLLKPMLEGK